MSTVAGPVSAAAAMLRTGPKAELVQNSVDVPVTYPAVMPAAAKSLEEM